MKHVLLGVTGSIAAYKAAELVRMFVDAGDEVRVAMTDAACRFVAPLTFQTLSRYPVSIDSFAQPDGWKPGHISLADWADVAVVAPASANTLAKMRCGIADNLLSSLLLATKAPVAVAPAMNVGMWENPATQENIAALAARGIEVIGPETGFLACGTNAKGRMSSPAEIFEAVNRLAAARPRVS